MTVQVVRLEPEDFPRLDALIAAAEAEGFAPEPHASSNRLDEAVLFAVAADGALVGCGAVLFQRGAPARLANVYVLPERRRAGIGRALAGALLHEALENAETVTLTARGGAACSFWCAMGLHAGDGSTFEASR